MPPREQEDEQPLPSNVDHVRLLFPNAYLSAADLHGQDVHLTVDRVVIRKMRTEQGTEPRAVVHFRELDALPKDERKVFVLSAKINGNTIAKALNEPNPAKWAGRRITLYPTECEAFGKTVECIRVRSKAPAAQEQTRARPAAAPAPAPAATKTPNAEADYLKTHPDRQLVTDTRRRLFGDKSPLSQAETHQLAEAVRRGAPAPPATEPTGTDGDWIEP